MPVRGATNQSFVTTSSILKTGPYPQFTSTAPGLWDTGVAGAYQPHSPTHYVYSQRADIRYQRLMNSISPTAADKELTFFASHDTEQDWDFLFVEAHLAGEEAEDWRTLPAFDAADEPITSNSTGLDELTGSCINGWYELHPWLEQYHGAEGTADFCGGDDFQAPDRNATSGRSPGWQEWHVPLPPEWYGQEVEVSISYAQDWATQGLGVWIDDIDAPGATADTDFENGVVAGWTAGDPTQIGSGPNPLDWLIPTTDVGFTEGAMTSMDPSGEGNFRTLYFGFGFENVEGDAARNEIMADALAYLTAP